MAADKLPLRQAEPRSPVVEPYPRDPAIPLWQSHELLSGAREALIQHEDSRYRLRLTRSNKLILTK